MERFGRLAFYLLLRRPGRPCAMSLPNNQGEKPLNPLKIAIAALAVVVCVVPRASASAIVLYGDQDGFGVGATTFKDPGTSSASAGEAAGTDVRLIGAGFAAPAFSPTSALTFAPQAGITSILLTMSMAEFGGNVNSVEGPNTIVLDGLAVSSAFLDSFGSVASLANPNVVTRSVSLPSQFFALFADGSVSLAGTRISEASGFGSFQVDFMRFDVETAAAVPEPASLLLLGTGVAALMVRRRRA